MAEPRLLVVEDDRIAQKIAKLVLENLGCIVDLAEDDETTLQHVHQNHYQLIFMDLGLKNGINGFEVTKMIRNINGYQTIPIVALTAHITLLYKAHAFEIGMDDFLIKPLSTEKAKGVLEKLKLMPQ